MGVVVQSHFVCHDFVMLRSRSSRTPRLGPDQLAHLQELPAAGSDLPGRAATSSRRRRTRTGTRLFGFGAALVMLGQCGNGCAPTQVTPTGTAASPGVYTLQPLGAQLPTEEQCAAEVRANPSPETRPLNAPYNNTTWQAHPTFFPRATGNFTGSTDDIIRWAACKWGYDENLLRAQVAKEAWGKMDGLGGWTTDPVMCLPGHGIGVDGTPGQCPQVAGLMQVSGFYFPDAIEGSMRSTAYNLEIGLATWRNCFDGNETWLNNVNRGRQYTAGDMWGCVGRWFSGRWHTSEANWYMGELQSYMDRRIWESRDYLSDTGPSA
jgi:autotransporter family porin